MGDIPVGSPFAHMPDHSAPWPPAGPSRAAPPPTATPTTTGPDNTATAARPAKQRNCAACRLRRVKCERPPGRDECFKCLERGLRCVPYEGKDKTQLRNGKRVKAAKELYGDLGPSSHPSMSMSATPASSAGSPPAVIDSGALAPSVLYSSGDVRLGTIELKETVMSSLLDSFFSFRSVAVFDGDVNFKKTFDLAGRRIEQLDDANQVLCTVLLALGARCSDHPALIGSSAPSMSSLRDATHADTDLRMYGSLRAHACDTLVQQALQLADVKGSFRKASPENVAALILLEGLLGVPRSSGGTAEDFSAQYSVQVRDLLSRAQEDPEIAKRMQGTVLTWTAFIRDAFNAASTGQTPTFSEDDFWLLRGEEDAPPSLSHTLARPSSGHTDRDYWSLVDSFTHHIAYLGRDTAASLTSPRARKRPRLDEGFARRYLDEGQEAMDALPELLRRTAALQAPPKFRSDAATLVRGLRLSVCNSWFLFLRVVRDRLALRPAGIIGSVEAQACAGAPDDAYWERLARLEREALRGAFRASREMCATLREVLDQGIPLGTHEWLDVRGAQLLFGRLPVWSRLIVERPTEEEGGWPGYSIRDKVDDLRTIARALRSVGWASATLAQPLDTISAELARAEAQQAFFAPVQALAFDSSTPFGSLEGGLEAFLAQQVGAPTGSDTERDFLAAASPAAFPPALDALNPLPQAEFDALLQSLGSPPLSSPDNPSCPSMLDALPVFLADSNTRPGGFGAVADFAYGVGQREGRQPGGEDGEGMQGRLGHEDRETNHRRGQW